MRKFATNRLVLLLAALLVMWAPGSVHALDPTRSIAQMYHRTFGRDDGLPGAVTAIAQTTDGFLWIGTASGLYRFDGVLFERIATSQLLSLNVTALKATPDGDLWIGYLNGGASKLRGATVVNFPSESGGPSGKISFSDMPRSGDMWANGGLVPWRFNGGKWATVPGDWGTRFEHGGGLWALLPGVDGTMWGKDGQHVYYCRPGCAHFNTANGYAGGVVGFAHGADGRVWTSDTRAPGRMYAMPDISGVSDDEIPGPIFAAQVPDGIRGKIFLDRDGTLWNISREKGIRRVDSIANTAAAGQVDAFTMRDGLSADKASVFFEDSEGDIWVVTNLGLDQFRPANVVVERRIPIVASYGYLAARTADALYFFASTSTDATSPLTADAGPIYRVAADGSVDLAVPDVKGPEFMGTLSDGAVRVGTMQGWFRLADNQLVREQLPPQAAENSGVGGAIEDAQNKLWLGLMESGVWRRDSDQWSHVSVRPDRPNCSPSILARDSAQGIWVTCREDGSLARFADGRAQVFRPDDGPNVGPVGLIQPDSRGMVFGGEFGLSRYDQGGFHTLRTERIPELSFVTGIIEAEGRTWVHTQSGILRFDTAELERALLDPDTHPHFDFFNRDDGLPGDTQQDTGINTALAGPDGKLWFITNRGVVWIDPHRMAFNPVPPPVAIRSVIAAGRTYTWPADVDLAAGTSNLQIDYAALSFVEPRRVQFRYKLDGVDNDWVDPGARRQAFYTKLGPGDYRFHVTASNNDGVWNTAGATFAFSIPPTFIQSKLFFALGLIATSLALWALYALRLRQVSVRIRERLEERMAERERIARELHDTLLQGFQGVMLHVRSVGEQIPAHLPAQALLSGVLDRAEGVLVEGRDRVRNLRAVSAKGDLAQALAAARSWHVPDPSVKFQVTVEGTPRALHPIVEEEVCRIGEEAISNAFQHARAGNIDVVIAYARSELALRVQDDGIGIDASLLDGSGKEGHFGLTGMRERAEKIRAEIRFESRRGAGTEVRLTVPARVAYADPTPRWFGFALGRTLNNPG